MTDQGPPRRSARNKPSHQTFQLYRGKGKTVLNVYDLLPGLNDITDAFEALPMDIIKYFTLLKEIDAKCINTTPQINTLIERYIDDLHREDDSEKNGKVLANGDSQENKDNTAATGDANGLAVTPKTESNSANGTVTTKPTPLAAKQEKRLKAIKSRIHEIIPCLEEKMHVTSVAKDLMTKHMTRINADYKVIVTNNEIPELIRIGPLNHPAMTNDTTSQPITTTGGRSELRREALAARKAAKEDERGGAAGGRRQRETPPYDSGKGSLLNLFTTGNAKKARDITRPGTPTNGAKKKRRRDEDTDDDGGQAAARPATGNEPTYCYCNQVSFGKMVGCDGDDCKREWFHLLCIGFTNPPKGKWYCDDCLAKRQKARRVN